MESFPGRPRAPTGGPLKRALDNRQPVSSVPTPGFKKRWLTDLALTIGQEQNIAPTDEIEGMVAAQLVACHNATMECYRRAMLPEQTHVGWNDNLKQASKLSRTYAALLETLNRHRGKGQQKVTVEHVHVHEGGQAIVGNVETRGVGLHQKQRNNPMRLHMHQAPDAEPEHDAGVRVSPRRRRTADAECTAERHRARRREIRTPSSMGATPRTQSHAAERLQR